MLPAERYSLPIFSSLRLNREKSEDPERCRKWIITVRYVTTVLVDSTFHPQRMDGVLNLKFARKSEGIIQAASKLRQLNLSKLHWRILRIVLMTTMLKLRSSSLGSNAGQSFYS